MSPEIQNLEAMVRDVPAMPTVAQKIMEMLGDPRATNAVLADTLSSDQSMATRILQMANSPFFGTRQKIASVSGALFVLGHSALRSLIITVCTKGLFKNPGPMEEKTWEHALGTAVAARQIAETKNIGDPDEAFVAGLLHDIGKTSLIVVYHDAYEKLFERVYGANLSLEAEMAAEKAEFGYDHSEIGSRVISKWRLSPLLARIARRHHTTNAELLAKEDDPKALALVAQANLIVIRCGLGRSAPANDIDVISTIYNDVLEFDRESVLEVIQKTLLTYKEARDQFDLHS